MNKTAIVDALQKEYPNGSIKFNNEENPTEIVCELPDEPNLGVAIAVIDSSIPHVHQKTTEVYEVLKGTLTVTKNGIEHVLMTGEKITIEPGTIHSAKGNQTWIKVKSTPPWTIEDHFIA